MLRVVSDGKPIHTTRVVVGKVDKQTPIFSTDMQEIVFGPYWNVPTSIKVEEIRPYLRQEASWFGGGGWNTAVLQRHDLRVRYGGREVDPAAIDWNRVDIRTLELFQPPGPGNVLGRVKFVFPNKHDVYMHDTPQKFLFANAGAGRKPRLHAGAKPRSTGRRAAESRTRIGARRGPCRRSTPATTSTSRFGRKSPSTSPISRLKLTMTGRISTYGDIYGHDARMAAALKLQRWL